MSTPRHPPTAPRIELLYFDGCPGTARLLPDLRALAETARASLELHAIETPEQADAARFLGSPTLRVDGRDIEPGAEQRTDYGLKCRLYPNPIGDSAHVPRPEWIVAALATASTRS
ncbi:MAG TPA: hypothetical protein VFF79_02825 [Conexibacter sp.]|jgi:hypothetical protein|nr:hypothetical protein [Conexibacter sp.]